MPAPKRRPSKGEAERRAALQRLFAADSPLPPTDLTIRTDTPAPDAKQLAALGIKDPAELKLLHALHERRDELATQLADNPKFRAALDREPAAALAKLGISKDLAQLVQAGALKELLDRIRGVIVEVPGQQPAVGAPLPTPTPEQRPSLELLASTLAAARADAATQAQLQREPRPVVVAVAAATPPTGVTEPAALATVVDQVTTALQQVHRVSGSPAEAVRLAEDVAIRTVRLRLDRGA